MKINCKHKWIVIQEAGILGPPTTNGVQGIIFRDLFIQHEWAYFSAALIQFHEVSKIHVVNYFPKGANTNLVIILYFLQLKGLEKLNFDLQNMYFVTLITAITKIFLEYHYCCIKPKSSCFNLCSEAIDVIKPEPLISISFHDDQESFSYFYARSVMLSTFIHYDVKNNSKLSS